MAGTGRLSPMDFVRKFKPHMAAASKAPIWLPARMRNRNSCTTLGKVGSLEARLTKKTRELRQAQRLRYNVFYEEMSAIPDAQTQFTKLDRDAYDAICDHILVYDHNSPHKTKPFTKARPRIVGTYRLLPQNAAELNNGFYTAGEFDVQPLLDKHSNLNFLELGRSCVLKPYRNKKTLDLLWHGIWAYVLENSVDVMIGCASIEGTDPNFLAEQLSFLHHHARAPEEWRVSALPERYTEMNRMAKEEIDQKAVLRSLPPLIKGYLRLGAYIGDGAVVDHQFGTTDVLIILPVSALNARYVNYYGADASRYNS